MISISPEQVRAEVEKFWRIMCGKSRERLEDLYASSAMVLTGKARKPEPAQAALDRRARQISSPSAEAVAELGAIDVQVAEAGVAIASYTYKFHQKRPDQAGGVMKRHTMFGRATQIFQVDAGGKLRIVHEHLSAATNPEVEKTAAS
jgi:ketosteroid isomerase-like protein